MGGLLKGNKGELITALIIFLLEALFFSALLMEPNSHIFSDASRDSIKNYYVYSYATSYDYGTSFSGMNYPFGDQVLFVDSQFPLTAIVHFIDVYLFGGTNHSTAALNLLLLLSYMVCGIFLYKILREFAVGVYFSIVLAVFITALSPQLQCFTHYYSLAYLHVFPGAWYCIIKIINSSKPVKWMFFLFFHTLFFSLIHFYYLAMILFFALINAVFYVLLSRKELWRVLQRQLVVIGSLLTVVFSILVFLHFTNHIKDRVQEPWGFFALQSSIANVFYPPSWNVFNLVDNNSGNTEGYAYIGLACDVLLFLSLLIFFKRLYKLQIARAFLFSSSPFFNSFLAAAVILLIFSIKFPFFLYNFFYEHLKFIIQFRARGRFAWIFYYVSCVYCGHIMYMLYRFMRLKRKNTLALIILTPLLICWAVDGYYNNISATHNIRKADMNFSAFKNNGDMVLLRQANLSATDFQAILALPFSHIGSELFNRDFPDVLATACMFSYNFHLPMLDSYLNRTSVSETETLLQLGSGPFIRKTIVNYLPNKKPLLLIINKHDSLTNQEHLLLLSAHCFYENNDFSLSVLPASAFSDSISEIRSSFFNHRQLLYNYDKYFTSVNTNGVIFRKLGGGSGASFLSSGDSGFSRIIYAYEGYLRADSINQKFELSLWQKVNTDKFSLPEIKFDQYSYSGKLVNEKLYYANVNSLDFYNGWIRASLQFTSNTLHDSISVKVWDYGKIKVSDLLIRPLNVNVYANVRLKDSSFTFNNYIMNK